MVAHIGTIHVPITLGPYCFYGHCNVSFDTLESLTSMELDTFDLFWFLLPNMVSVERGNAAVLLMLPITIAPKLKMGFLQQYLPLVPLVIQLLCHIGTSK